MIITTAYITNAKPLRNLGGPGICIHAELSKGSKMDEAGGRPHHVRMPYYILYGVLG